MFCFLCRLRISVAQCNVFWRPVTMTARMHIIHSFTMRSRPQRITRGVGLWRSSCCVCVGMHALSCCWTLLCTHVADDGRLAHNNRELKAVLGRSRTPHIMSVGRTLSVPVRAAAVVCEHNEARYWLHGRMLLNSNSLCSDSDSSSSCRGRNLHVVRQRRRSGDLGSPP